ncbi:uncharacterized protein EI90DRAFT_3013550 [Cantharellus anzutake]|uniref:uncharacterized protein n=1 Tax=Cantharellus anzutake TaxID=1750568 RepID=UPI0019070B2D|nr:uncharacterized protein EI90DRAFT_3013550 [Cantharellus anzutake]KAF8338295.1 hypothetical protein EI90DRAFT_3013550 [Cantharellus anzutake]
MSSYYYPQYGYPQYVYPQYPVPYSDPYMMAYPQPQNIPRTAPHSIPLPQEGQNAIRLDNARQKLNFGLRWEDHSSKEMDGKTVWYSSVYIDDVLSGTGQASKKGVARDQAAYQALLRLTGPNYAIGG